MSATCKTALCCIEREQHWKFRCRIGNSLRSSAGVASCFASSARFDWDWYFVWDILSFEFNLPPDFFCLNSFGHFAGSVSRSHLLHTLRSYPKDDVVRSDYHRCTVWCKRFLVSTSACFLLSGRSTLREPLTHFDFHFWEAFVVSNPVHASCAQVLLHTEFQSLGFHPIITLRPAGECLTGFCGIGKIQSSFESRNQFLHQL